jgi:1,2-diacylglycerol 3-alpha-glucosyltransferase
MKYVSSETVDHGIDISKFIFSKIKKRQFCIVSQLIPRKNISSILKKFSAFLQDKSYSDFTLMIIGRGELESVLKKECFELGIQDNVRFVGFLNHKDMVPFLRDSMALLIDTKQDNNMVSIAESVVCGTPVLTNTIPTNSYLIQEKSLGISKQEWNKEDLKLIVDQNDFFIENCRLNRNSFSYEKNAKNIIDIFNRISKQ